MWSGERDNRGRYVKYVNERFCNCGKKLSLYTKSIICQSCSSKIKSKSFMCSHNTKHTDDTKKKISLSRVGKGKWLGLKRNLPEGENHHRWLGGKSTMGDKIRKSKRYLEWKMFVLERDNYTCHDCNKRGGKLEVHHIKQFALILFENNIKSLIDSYRCSILWDLNNGQTLCINCHNKTKKYGERIKKE
jgi:hypothetical protein